MVRIIVCDDCNCDTEITGQDYLCPECEKKEENGTMEGMIW